jgi:hypothetical protein
MGDRRGWGTPIWGLLADRPPPSSPTRAVMRLMMDDAHTHTYPFTPSTMRSDDSDLGKMLQL